MRKYSDNDIPMRDIEEETFVLHQVEPHHTLQGIALKYLTTVIFYFFSSSPPFPFFFAFAFVLYCVHQF